MDSEISIAFGHGLYDCIGGMIMYMENEVRRRINGLLGKNQHQLHLQMYFERAVLLMQSLKKLNGSLDGPVAMGIDRTLLEILTYAILVHKDSNKNKLRNTDAVIPAWEESANHHLARQTVKFYGRGKAPEHLRVREFFKKQVRVRRRVLARRRRFWNRDTHPTSSWTGRQFRQDVEYASTLWKLSLDSYSSLEELYIADYSRMCIYVHGAAFLGFRYTVPRTLVDVSASAFFDAIDLAFEICKVVLTDYGYVQALPDLRQEWERIKFKKASIIAKAVMEAEKKLAGK
jgi:hypothetical protein